MADNKKEIVSSWEKLGINPTSITQVPNLLDLSWGMDQKLTLCLVGETGIGKTPIVKQWVAGKKGFIKTLNFGHMTQEEVSMIMFNEEGTEFDFVPPTWLLRLNEEAESKGCAVLFLDEWNRGDKALVNALFTLTDERRIHSFILHRNVLVVAAMNPSDGSYLVNEAEKDHAIRKRLCFVFATHDLAGFIKHAKDAKWHPLVPEYLKADNTSLYDTKARDAGKCFPCPSNWEKVSSILKSAEKLKMELSSPTVEAMVVGQIGSATASRFMEFVRDQNVVIRPSEVLMEYKHAEGAVRKRVKALLSGNNKRHDVISNLNEGLAIEIFSSRHNPATIAESLATYIADLPSDLLSSFLSQSLLAQTQSHSENEQYLARLTQHMAPFPVYKARLKEITQVLAEYRRKLKSGTEKDPMKD